MSTHRRLPVQAAPVRVVHYADVADRSPARTPDLSVALYEKAAQLRSAELVRVATNVVLAEQQRAAAARHADYVRWLDRQAEFERRDRKVRAVLLGAGATVVLVAVGGAWWLYQAVSGAVTGAAVGTVLGVAAVVVAGAGVVAGGRKCITVVQHWHE
ncbi:hypothetical protein KZZ52_49965 [Dactylosporangium sp. AC04546]|uniref:hypothetical protein n=1 Tax=Dactylosporangium sp. AC04546 TaxID=2862460 RepID=UPI001EDD202E|nr:hypothetical protein [Dactylosporangium sp. AC04546]WVK82012.1 hypothetical protein KZZ52_49965 [Dactylosporangium sp. AC04546]